MTVQRLLLQLLPALLAMLFVATTPAAAWFDDTGVELLETVPKSTAPAQPTIDHASRKKLRFNAALEEFFEIDDDAEQYFKLPPVLSRYTAAGVRIEVRRSAVSYRAAPRPYRIGATYPTGPPHA